MEGGWAQRARALVPKLLVSVILGGGFVWVLRRGGVPLLPDRAALSGLAWWGIPSAIVTMSVATYFRTCRWVYLLRPIAPEISAARTLGIGLVGFTAITFAPLRSGEFVRPYLLARDGEVTFAQALAATAVERIVDGLIVAVALFFALAVATPLSPLPDHVGKLRVDVIWVRHAAYAALALFAAAFAVLVAFYRYRLAAARLVSLTVGRVSPRLAELATEKVSRVADGLSALPSRAHRGPFLRDTAIYFLSVEVGQWITLNACGVPATLPESFVVLGVLSLAILVPAGPGFFGAYQMSAFCSLAMFFPERVTLSAGAAFVFLNYLAQMGVTLASCAVGFWLMAKNPPASALPPGKPEEASPEPV